MVEYPLIHDIFSAEEAMRICSLALSPHGQQDKLMWIGNSNGVFLVKSAYHLEKERLIRGRGGCSRATQSSKVWKKIWQLRVPRVVKPFLWRACNNSLPTRDNLFKGELLLILYVQSVGFILKLRVISYGVVSQL